MTARPASTGDPRPVIRPLILRQPTLGAVMAGRCTVLRRQARGALAAIQPGDLLWIREPFRLDRKWDRFSPTAADMLGARCYHAERLPDPAAFLDNDQPPGVDAPLGAERPARNLLRVWHRHHCLVTAIRTERLRDVTNAEIEAAGFATRAEFARDWNRGAAISGPVDRLGLGWSANPPVIVLGLLYVPAPVPTFAHRSDRAEKITPVREAAA